MSGEKIFVGRKAELEQFRRVLEDPKGQAVLVVGQAGMGKTWLINKMAELAQNHPDLRCGHVRYEVTKEDSVDSRLAIMIDDAFEAARNPKVFWRGDDKSKKQWIALYKILEAIPKAGGVFKAIRGLATSLKRDITKDSRRQFIEKLNIISERMPTNGRAVFIVDPEKYMKPESDEAWAIVVRDLPRKIKLLFAQRPEDVLVESETLGALDNISHIPERRLDVLEEQAVDELLDQRVTEMDYSVTEVRRILSKYKGHPYALQGVLDLLKAGSKIEELPQDPTGIAAAQWKELCKRGKDAIRLFKAYAILEVGVPDEVVTAVSELDTDTVQSLMADIFLGGLLREEGYGKRIYHALLADHIVTQIGDSEKRQYHNRAVAVYREKLKDARKKQTVPDALAATRLAEHTLAAEGGEAFVLVFIYECYDPLITLGLLDSAVGLSERALGYADKGSDKEAVILGNLGTIYLRRADLDRAEQMLTKALESNEKLGWLKGMASDYGNLGLIHKARGDLSRAEQMHTKAMEINEKLGRAQGMANQYGNLGVIYQTLGDLKKAEEMFQKVLDIDIKLGRLESIAITYGNLGLIYRTSGDMDRAERMITKALTINEKLGRLEGMANQYGNLGAIYIVRGNVEKAREYWEKAMELFKKIGMKLEIEKTQQAIDRLNKQVRTKKRKGKSKRN